MNDRFTAVKGRKAVSRDTAEPVGNISHLLVDATSKRIAALVIGKGRRARIVDWERLSGLGADAVMVEAEDALREPADEREQAGADGKLELLGQLALLESGTELGRIDDVVFDPDTGHLQTLQVGTGEHPASSLLGAGTYAVVLAATGSGKSAP
jgi:uncharacterized protein YrrD